MYAVRKVTSISPMFLIKAIKGGNPGMKILPPLYIYKDKNELSFEMSEIFKKFDVVKVNG